MNLIPRWVFAGLLATLTMDVGSALIRRTGLTSGTPPHLIGRWFASLAHGQLRHHTIADTPPVAGELAIALVCHYLVGISLAVTFGAFLALMRIKTGTPSTLALAVGFGVSTNLLPWLVMFPSMGFGLFGGAGPADWMLFRSSFVYHVLFGAGLALSTLALGLLATGASR